MSHETLKAQITTSVERAGEFLRSLQAPGLPRGVARCSPAHDPVAWPGVLLPGTYDSTMALDLIGGLDALSAAEKAAVARFIEEFRREDGIFVIPGMTDDTVYKKPDKDETWRYIHFHETNYAIGALDALGAGPAQLAFARPFLDRAYLEAWLSRRDLRDPWQEGNNLVNLGSFLLLLLEDPDPTTQHQAKAALDIVMDWHERYQEPATGFWGMGQTHSALQRLHAMAGATHNFHLYYALDLPVPYHEAIVDYCLSLPLPVSSACIDVDIVDILAAFHRLKDYRRAEIETWLAEKTRALIGFQNGDGGFADVLEGERRVDGWVKGYKEPQGISNAFATWFRLIALAMTASILFPGWRRWRFRRTIGIGYFRWGWG